MIPELNTNPDIEDKYVFPSRYNYEHLQSKIFNKKICRNYFLCDCLFGHGFWDEYLNHNDEWIQYWVKAEPEFIAWCDLMHSIRTR
jgi:hypothetical protein